MAQWLSALGFTPWYLTNKQNLVNCNEGSEIVGSQKYRKEPISKAWGKIIIESIHFCFISFE